MNSIVQHIEQATGKPFIIENKQMSSGGSINDAFVLSDTSGQRYFVKTNQPGRLSMFEAEAMGLQAMADSNTIRVPSVVCYGEDNNHSYIVMEYIDLSGRVDQHELGTRIARLHQVTNPRFGWQVDNTIGATFQGNAWHENWQLFWREQRLGFQLQLAADNGYGGELQSLGEKLLSDMDLLFTGHKPVPAMLHGDLWAGNVAGLRDGTPVIYDPALYFGDSEADLAMTYLFGGFTADFYRGYQAVLPLDEGFAVRKTFYNIYHIINHLNLFGGGYQNQAIHMMQQVLSEI